MGRPPCCDKLGIKKGPWTPEEDIILVSYIQEHGPGNWRSVPTNTGLLRCSKSCRLRWTNYLRPGIKRGNFTPHEEGMIIHLQALLGNKWAAIASYLPQRTDNDIKNYWNTHLKKKMKKSESILDPQMESEPVILSKSLTRSNDHHHEYSSTTELTLNPNSSSQLYASSTENISRLLEGWMKSSSSSSPRIVTTSNSSCDNICLQNKEPPRKVAVEGGNLESTTTDHEFESFPSLDNLNSNTYASWEMSMQASSSSDPKNIKLQKPEKTSNPPVLSLLETWLLDEMAVGQVLDEAESMELLPLVSS